jgi:Protein of unknown function (DUF4242)
LGEFVDTHACAEVSSDALQRGLAAARQSVPNAAGACPLDYLVAAGGRIVCIVEAPNEEAVKRLHEELGWPSPRPVAVEGAHVRRPLTEYDRQLIVQLLASRSV